MLTYVMRMGYWVQVVLVIVIVISLLISNAEIKCVGLPSLEFLQTYKQCQVLGSHQSDSTLNPVAIGCEKTKMELERPE